VSLDEDLLKLRQDGYVVQRNVLAADEVEELRETVERVAQDVFKAATRPEGGLEIRLPEGHRIQFSSQSAIQWEWLDGSQAIRIIEPIDHLDNTLLELFEHPRLREFAAMALDVERVAPFTSKLNLKRAREGSRFPWHQDFPYWYVRIEEQAHDIVTAVILLDDADAENGALRALPGSHLGGPFPRDPNDSLHSLADPARIDESKEVLLEAPAGSIVWFGSLLLHRSAPNLSDRDRRAILHSFQPHGRAHYRDTPFNPHYVARLP
jgi:ectoine hydroxylase